LKEKEEEKSNQVQGKECDEHFIKQLTTFARGKERTQARIQAELWVKNITKNGPGGKRVGSRFLQHGEGRNKVMVKKKIEGGEKGRRNVWGIRGKG